MTNEAPEIPSGTWVSQGTWDVTTDVVPAVGALGDSIKAGYNWRRTGSGPAPTLTGPDGGPVIPSGLLVAAKDSPNGDTSDPTQWTLIYEQV